MLSSNDIEAIARMAYLPRRIAVGDLSTIRPISHATLASSPAVLQIGAGAKRLVACPGQHDDADILVVVGVAIALGDAGDHLAVQRVALLRPVDGDPERLPAFFEDDAVGVGHDLSHPFFWFRS